jgi:hypothetical protein
MTRPRGQPIDRLAAIATVVLALAIPPALAGCGDGSTAGHPNRPAPTIVSTSITPDGVSLSPDHLAAGPVKLVITNLTDASQQLAVASSDAGAFHQETAPINPQDTAQLRARLAPGSYTVSVRATGVRSASLAVRRRPTGAANPRRP